VSSPDAPLERFVRALHRRQVALRVVERAGVGLAWGCGAALLLVPVLLWRGLDVWAVVASALGAGALAGGAWGYARRPTALAAAAEADRQLRTADLLGTAWSLRSHTVIIADHAEPPWRRTVLALAADRVRGLSPSAVLLHRFGVRAWGGIALAVALVVTLGSFSSGPGSAAATARPPLADARRPLRSDAPRPLVDLTAAAQRQRRVDRNPGDDRDLSTESLPSPSAEPEPAEGPTARPQDPANSSNRSASAGTGDGSGRTDPEASAKPPAPSANPAAPSERSTPGARATGGAGQAAADAAGSDPGAGGTVATPDANDAPPPWQHPAWPAAAEAAGAAVRAGRVPDAYRDLVHDYFNRPASSAPPAAAAPAAPAD
jgi:hypothetical protein